MKLYRPLQIETSLSLFLSVKWYIVCEWVSCIVRWVQSILSICCACVFNIYVYVYIMRKTGEELKYVHQSPIFHPNTSIITFMDKIYLMYTV